MDLKKVCRVCLLPSEFMLSIFSAIQAPKLEIATLPILEIVKNFTGISVAPNDGLPEKICCNCLDKLHKSYTFKLKWEKSEAILKHLKDDKKSVYELMNSQNEYEPYTETSVALIKTEKTEDYELLEQDIIPEICEEVVTEEEMPVVQEIKQEPEIDINIEEKDRNETDSDENGSKKDLRCSLCQKTFEKKRYLKAHMNVHTGERPFQCDLCQKKFRSKPNLTGHMRTAHADGSTNHRKFKCATCSKSFLSKSLLNRHLISHTEDRPFLCDLCPKKFQSKSSLTAHMQTAHVDGVTNIGKFKCATCSKLFGNKFNLNAHMTIHSGEKPFQCEFCPKKFRLKNHLMAHMRTLQHADGTVKSGTYKCPTCSKLFEHERNLNQHMIIHTEERPFQCKECPKNFRFRAGLRVHMQRAHVDETTINVDFKCTTCSRLCVSKSHLEQHMITHTEDRPFQCEICLKKFRCKYYLNLHLNIHAGEKPFQCEDGSENVS